MAENFNERLIIEGCVENDRKCQELLYRKFFPTMRLMCMRYTQDEDRVINIVNDGFLKVFKNAHKFEFKGSLEGWIRRIVYHCLSDYFKKENKYLKFMVFEEKDENVEETGLQNLIVEDILKLINGLPKSSQQVFRLYALEGCPHKEIAERLSISVGTSKWHLNAARTKLKEMILTQNSNQGYAG